MIMVLVGIIAFIILLIILLVLGYGWIALGLVLIAGGVMYYIYRRKKIYLAMYHMQQGKMDKAMDVMTSIKDPEKLAPAERGMYYLTCGNVFMQDAKFPDAERMFHKALEAGFKDPNQEAMVHLNLAGIYFNRKNVNKGRELVRKAKKMATMDEIKAEIKKIEAQLKQAGIKL